MLPAGRSKNFSRSYEFRKIICPLNKHRQYKQNFGNFFKIQVFEVDINDNGISRNCNVKVKRTQKIQLNFV